MKKTTFLLIFVSICSLQINAMRSTDHIIDISLTKPLLNEAPSLCGFLNRNLIDLSCISTFKEFAITARALAITDKSLNLFINNTSRTLDWIRHYSDRCQKSNIDIAEQLGTYEASCRYVIQRKNMSNISLNKLISAGYDCNFTYHNHQTQLMHLASYTESPYSLEPLAKWLITYSDINQQDRMGKNALMMAIETNKSKLVSMLLDCEQLDMHCKDASGNTLLHCCIESLLPWHAFKKSGSTDISRYECMHEVIEELLRRGADSTVKNNNGQTPLEFALNPDEWNLKMEKRFQYTHLKFVPVKIDFPPIIDLLKQAELTFARKN